MAERSKEVARRHPVTDSEGAKHALGVKEWIGFAFSAMALSVSAVTYYTNNILVKDKAYARIADLSVGAGGFVVVQVAFFNAGNRPALVLGSEYQLSDRPSLDDGGFGGDVEVDSETFPMVLAPRDLKLADLRIPLQAIIANYSSGAVVSPEDDLSGEARLERVGAASESLRRFYAGLRVKAVDSLGVTHISWSGMQVAIDVSPTHWASLSRIGKEEDFPLTPLFE